MQTGHDSVSEDSDSVVEWNSLSRYGRQCVYIGPNMHASDRPARQTSMYADSSLHGLAMA
jgi:uncharacterized membrane protein